MATEPQKRLELFELARGFVCDRDKVNHCVHSLHHRIQFLQCNRRPFDGLDRGLTIKVEPGGYTTRPTAEERARGVRPKFFPTVNVTFAFHPLAPAEREEEQRLEVERLHKLIRPTLEKAKPFFTDPTVWEAFEDELVGLLRRV